MGTRGLYGFRKNGIDKCTYNHWDSYPSCLGSTVVEFCKNHTIEEMNYIFDKIVLVDENSTPTEKQIEECIENGYSDFSVGSGAQTDWYCLLRNCQGDLECLAKAENHAYMIDGIDFIKDSLYCEYAYIINLDDKVLEFYEGFQNTPQKGNRYGIDERKGFVKRYYPCKLSGTFPLNEIYDVDKIIEMMNLGENAEEILELVKDNSNFNLTPFEARDIFEEIGGNKKIIAIYESLDEAAEHEARELGYLTDNNKRYFNLDLYGKDMCKNNNYMGLEASTRVVCYED